ncbi:MAG TPA: hypothetical protein VGP72_05990 [Planctomycetota bacterium]
MSDNDTVQPAGAGQLWYCCQCTRMISPPGAAGVIGPGGEHYCAACAPAKGKSASVIKVESSRASSKSSSRIPLPQPAPAETRISGITKAQPARAAAAKSQHNTVLLAAGIAGAGVLMLVIGIIATMSGGKGDSEHAESRGPASTPNSATPAKNDREAARPAATASKDPGSGESRPLGPSFLQTAPRTPPAETSQPRPLVPLPEPPKPDANVAPAANTAPAPGTPPQATASTDQKAFEDELKQAVQLDEKQRYGAALEKIKGINARFSSAPWWDSNKAKYAKTEQTIQDHLAEHNTEADDAQRQAAKTDKLEDLGKLESVWKQKLAALGAGGQPDEVAAKPARSVLKTISDKRGKILEERKQGALADIPKQIETLQRQLKERGFNTEARRKQIEELEAKVMQCDALDGKLAEQFAGLRFDAASSHESDLTCYKVPVKQISNTLEVAYDFKSKDDIGPWVREDGNDALIDPDKKALVFRHPADKGNGRDHRTIRLPFEAFSPAQWSIEVEATLASNRNKLEYGLLVFDGSGCEIRMGVRQITAKDMQATICGNAGGGRNIKQRGCYLTGHTKDTVRFKMTCSQGVVACAVNDAATGRSVVFDPEKMTFEARWVGLYIHVHDKEEESSALFSRFKLNGQLNADKLRQSVSAAVRKDVDGGKILFKDWAILGPFKNDQASAWEKGAGPKSTLDVGTVLKQQNWLRPFSPTSLGIVDLRTVLKSADAGYAYAAVDLEADKDVDGMLAMSSDDGVVAWLDGNELYRNPRPGGVNPDEFKVPVKLAAGAHTLVLRIDNINGDWGYCARLATPDCKGPLPGARLRYPAAVKP